MTRSIDTNKAVLKRLGVSLYDLPTHGKIPLIRDLMAATGDGAGDGLALDIGIGTGYTTYSIFNDRPTVCVDVHQPNLRYYRHKLDSVADSHPTSYVVAPATALPFRDGMFRYILCSEVLEHLQDDAGAVQEIARVLHGDGRAVITVPYIGLGFTSFLELLHIKTVHDFPGPECHVRPGYDEQSLSQLLTRYGLEIERRTFYLRFFSRLAVDVISLLHLVYQRVVHRRQAWTWAEAAEAESGFAFRVYTWLFPFFLLFSRLDRLVSRSRGFGIIVSVRKSRNHNPKSDTDEK